MIKRNIYLLWAIGLLQGMVFYAPVATLYRQAAGLGIFHITLLESISLFLTICLEVPWGWAADRIGYRKTMLVCCGLYFVSKLVFWRAEGFAGFLLERVMLSVVCAGLSGVDSSMLYLSCGKEDSHRVFSIYQNMGEAGMLAAALVHALWIGERYRLAGFLTAVSYGAAAVLAMGLQEVRPERKEASLLPGTGIRPLLRQQLGNKKILLLLTAAALLGESHQLVTVFLSQMQYVRAGMSHRWISIAYILASLAGLSGGFSAALCARTGPKKLGLGLFAAAALSCLAMAGSMSAVVSVAGILVLRTAHSLLLPLKAELENRMVTGHERATALSMNAVMQDSFGIFLNLMLGILAQHSLPAAMAMAGVLCAAGGIAFRVSKCYE